MTTASALSDFVTAQEVRAVLGVAPEELEDQTLAMPLYLRQLQFGLSDIHVDLESTYLSVSALSSRSAAQQKLFDVMQVYAAYAISRFLLIGLPLFAPRVITDGKAATERVADPYADTREGVDAGYSALRQRLRDAFEALGTQLTTSVNTFTYSVSAGLVINPVTGS